MALFIKPTVNNIINLWFGADTPIRQFKIKHNPDLWEACLRTNHSLRTPSKKHLTEQYRKSDKAAFARAVQQEMERTILRSSFSQKEARLV